MISSRPHRSAIGPRSVRSDMPVNALPHRGFWAWSAVVRDVPLLSHTQSELARVSDVGARIRGSADQRGPRTACANVPTQPGGDRRRQGRPHGPEGPVGQIIDSSLTSQNRCSTRALRALGT